MAYVLQKSILRTNDILSKSEFFVDKINLCQMKITFLEQHSGNTVAETIVERVFANYCQFNLKSIRQPIKGTNTNYNPFKDPVT